MVDQRRGVIPPGVVIIGSSGHGRDIASTLAHHRMISHHSLYTSGPYIIGINGPQVRAKVAAELGAPGLTWIHPTAYLGTECGIGEDVHINYGAMITRSWVRAGATICPGVTIGGDVRIGERAFVGMGAIIGVAHPGEKISIGHDAVIGAGTVVLHDIPAGETWVGNPSRRIK